MFFQVYIYGSLLRGMICDIYSTQIRERINIEDIKALGTLGYNCEPPGKLHKICVCSTFEVHVQVDQKNSKTVCDVDLHVS